MSSETSTPGRPVERRAGALRAVLVAVGLLVGGFLLTVVASVPVALALGALGYGLASNAFVVATFVANAIGFAVVALVYLRRWLGGGDLALPRGRLGLVAAVTVGSLAFALAAEVAYALLGGPATGTLVTDAIAADPLFALVYAALSVFVVAPAEELLFRGAIQGRLRRTFDAPVAVAGASLLFAAPHALNFAVGDLTGLFAAATIFVVSLAWGWAYDRTGSLAVPILAHGLYNAGLAAVAALSVAGVF
ncbi:MAG: lysostaphin resistance A-like protein [Haloarculaceae archaeon]